MATQWRSSGYGATGLDYNVLYHKMDRMKLSDAEYDDMEVSVRTLEDAALEEMRKKWQTS